MAIDRSTHQKEQPLTNAPAHIATRLLRVATSQVRRFEPDRRWFICSPNGIHGIAHESRVLIWTQTLAEMVYQEGLSVDAEVLAWAAAVHDTQRWNDGADPEHGTRAATWIENHSQLLPANVPVDRVAYLCRWHVPWDDNVPQMTQELMVFKDADALDRWRIGDLDRTFLRTDSARSLLGLSYALWERTHSCQESDGAFSAVANAAEKLGVLISK